MAWWYEIRDQDNRVVETRRGFPSQKDAEDVGERARRAIQDISPDRALKLVTGEDESRSA